MFLNDVHIAKNATQWNVEMASVSVEAVESRNDADDYQTLLNAVDAARAGLASDEHDYDCTEEEGI